MRRKAPAAAPQANRQQQSDSTGRAISSLARLILTAQPAVAPCRPPAHRTAFRPLLRACHCRPLPRRPMRGEPTPGVSLPSLLFAGYKRASAHTAGHPSHPPPSAFDAANRAPTSGTHRRHPSTSVPSSTLTAPPQPHSWPPLPPPSPEQRQKQPRRHCPAVRPRRLTSYPKPYTKTLAGESLITFVPFAHAPAATPRQNRAPAPPTGQGTTLPARVLFQGPQCKTQGHGCEP
ncbi:hypothetical protein SETIT_4G162100v2 [Setaria italica]|uniref:Uncharacterized protein n=1 Tax=Setaria italica TaxID=4555 RepID=A0A368QUV0_SETIT|nr:hypothetical protein SETIT_4G162100v2 [Setaria italica]